MLMRFCLPINDIPVYDPNDINPYYYTVVYTGDYHFENYKEGKGSHPGVDIDTSKYPNGNIQIYACMDGIVEKVRRQNDGFGYHIVIRHENAPHPSTLQGHTTLYSCYAHLSEIRVQSAQFVQCGDIIGISGNTGNSTGAHLHFQIDKQSAPFHPYWPFTVGQREAKGLSFWDAVNE